MAVMSTRLGHPPAGRVAAIADLALLRAVPGLTIWIPADDGDVEPLMTHALDGAGPSYLRLCRDPVTRAVGDGPIGVGLRMWTSPDAQLTLVASG
jgi:transketolase